MVTNAAKAGDVEIRVLAPTDAAALWKVRLEALEREPKAFSEAADEHRAHSVEEIAARIAATPARFSLGAFVAGGLVGTLRFERSQRQKNQHRGSLHAMYVDRQYRHSGIGRELLQHMLQMLREQKDLEQVELCVGANQTAAKRLYESFGFTYCGKELRALKIGNEYVDYDVMWLKLR